MKARLFIAWARVTKVSGETPLLLLLQDVQAFRRFIVTLRTLVADAQARGKTGDALAETVMPVLTEKYGQWDAFKYFAKPNILRRLYDAPLGDPKHGAMRSRNYE